ncbi:DUF4387 family protein [Pseudorhodobacter ferrugineus]|uniref:DUF4387 family protein n=1 Tax=Pseudorhodobacter ferrugineus TaxID=77008 RepID=UPI0003B3F54B|nr:DUF4387 family protein [Pseudorhodobacter ferrugineus]
MTQVRDIALKVRSKNAGPFWVTIDVFCGSSDAYTTLTTALKTDAIAALYHQPTQLLKRFDIPDLNVIKFSFPRPVIQGHRLDRDMHGAGWSTLLAELDI